MVAVVASAVRCRNLRRESLADLLSGFICASSRFSWSKPPRGAGQLLELHLQQRKLCKITMYIGSDASADCGRRSIRILALPAAVPCLTGAERLWFPPPPPGGTH